jgi:signal transduction histidine kinase
VKKRLVEWRLLAGFSALLFLIVAIGLIGIFQIRSLSKTVDSLGRNYLPAQESALKMRINNNLYAMGIRNYVFWKGSKYLEAARATADLGIVQRAAKEFDRQLDIYASHLWLDEQRQWVKEISASERELRAVGSGIIGLVDENARQESINKSLMTFESQLYRIDDFIDKTIQEFNLNAIKDELGRADLQKSRAITFLKWSLLVGVLIGAETAWLVYRNRRRERERREQLVRRMIRLEEENRTNLSFQIHDQMGQDLSALRIYLDLADKKVPEENKEVKEKVMESRKILSGLIEKTHNISELLRPPALDEVGLIDTIAALILQYKQMTGINFVYQKPSSDIRPSSEYSLAIYRITQEALTNVARHAQAKSVRVSLELKDKTIRLTVEDDGVGFNYKDFLERSHRREYTRGGLGLLGLKERVELLGGIMDIDTSPGKGTRLNVQLPSAKT